MSERVKGKTRARLCVSSDGTIKNPNDGSVYNRIPNLGESFIFPFLEGKLSIGTNITKEWMKDPDKATKDRWNKDYPKNPEIVP